jgi:DNA replication initiation complex subunit (GINS family)
MADKEINITYDTLFELLRREKNREELQPLQESFFSDVVGYLREKELILRKTDEDNVFSAGEREKTRTQLENVRKIIKELYDRRERKIVEMAIFKSRTNSSLINTKSLLTEERLLFESLIAELNRFRNGVLINVLSTNSPNVSSLLKDVPQGGEGTGGEGSSPAANGESGQKSGQEGAVSGEETGQAAGIAADSGMSRKGMKESLSVSTTVKFTSHVPKFVGRELEVYGPFEPQDIANLPRQIADILINKGRAEKIEVK